MLAGAAMVNRECPICAGTSFNTVHRQEFVLPDDVHTHYTVVACERCGFTFARDLPPPEHYEAYYRATTKYTYEGSRDAAAAMTAMHEPSFALIDSFLHDDREVRVLDIGCSTGELLALFSRAGYTQLEGVDPTPDCARIAQQLHGLTVKTAVLSELTTNEPYDLVMLANVLEHIPDLRTAVAHVAALVRGGGSLFVQVPDAGHFGSEMREPFLEFSIEHINYFTDASLTNLLAIEGFEPIALEHHVLRHKGVSFPVITSLWRKSGVRRPLAASDSRVLREYVDKSLERLAEVEREIDAIAGSGEPLAIWGVGALTARLLATTRLAQANVVTFVDSNRSQQGRHLIGREIHSPSWLAGKNMTVFVSSFVYGDEIRRILQEEFRYMGRVITI